MTRYRLTRTRLLGVPVSLLDPFEAGGRVLRRVWTRDLLLGR